MMNYNRTVFLEYNDPDIDEEARDRGYRFDVIVKKNNDYYKLGVYGAVALQPEELQIVRADFKDRHKNHKDIILVDTVTPEAIKKAVLELDDSFFEELKSWTYEELEEWWLQIGKSVNTATPFVLHKI